MMNGARPVTVPPAGGPVRRSVAPPIASPPGVPKRVVMRLKCRTRPVHTAYMQNGQILDMDSDVTFYCADGGVVKGHKVILASSSKMFTDMFMAQEPQEMSVVSVPDVRSDVMKLLLLMTYKEAVVVTAEQMERLKEATAMFCMDWDRLKREPTAMDVCVDIRPGKIMDSPKKLPPPLMARPEQPFGVHKRLVPSMMNNRTQGQHPNDMRFGGKPQTAVRTGMHQNSSRIASKSMQHSARDEEEDSDGSEDSNFTFQLQGYEPSEHNQERRKSKLTPRVENEPDDGDESYCNADPVENQKMIKDWIARVGKKDDHPEPKRARTEFMESGVSSHRVRPNHECTVCNATFIQKHAWKWHEERHVGLGLFKCSRCDNLAKTARSIWTHEQTVHGVCAIALADLEEPIRAIPSNFQVVEGRGKQAFRTQPIVGNRNAGSNLARLNQMRRKMAAAKKLPDVKIAKRAYTRRNPAIGIGQSIGSENLDSKKIKQLHWLYVCGKCDNCSDSSTKAVLHYRKCYPTQGLPFENTVTKFRQGFYGKSKCPLCTRRYAANGGFMIHCGHQHTEYRRLFSHTGAQEDKLKCVSCQRKFGLPDEFHEHLDGGQECNSSPINEESMPLLSSSRSGSGTPTDRNKRRTLVSTRSAATVEEASVSPVPLPPRSARLANRASLAAKRALAMGSIEEPKRKAVVMRRESGIDYPPADCPICGATEVANISQHLASDHQDLDVTVNRISTDMLRCRKCIITFAICDLLAHSNSCTGPDKVIQESQGQHRVRSEPEPVPTPVMTETKPKAEQKPQKEKEVPVNVEDLPPGVGNSPIDRIENVDLYSKETLRKALVCGVCGKSAVKLGDIATCLRNHGVHRCALCFNSYANKSDYPQHLKKCHGASNISNKLKCPLCNKAFSNAGQVSGHMYSSHWLSLLGEMRQELLLNGEYLKTGSTEKAVAVATDGGKDETVEPESESVEDDKMEVDADVNVNNESLSSTEENDTSLEEPNDLIEGERKVESRVGVGEIIDTTDSASDVVIGDLPQEEIEDHQKPESVDGKNETAKVVAD